MGDEKSMTEEAGTLGALLRLPYQTLARRMYRELAGSGFPDVRPAFSSVFRFIAPEGSRVTDLAERAQMTKQSMGYLVDALHERGYVAFAPDPDDRRAKRVRLTARGEAFHRAAVALSREYEAMLAERLGPEEMARLRELLSRLNEETERLPPLREAADASWSADAR